MKIVLFFLVLAASNSYATNQSLLSEFMDYNLEVFKARTDATISELDTAIALENKFWNLGVSTAYSDNTLDEATGSGVTKVKSFSKALSLTKDFNWGGSLGLSTGNVGVDPNDGNAVISSKTYSHFQKVSYSQSVGNNFLGRNDRTEIELARKSEELVKSSSELKTSSELLSFYSALLQASLNKTMVRLAKEAHIRSVTNTSLIVKRVRDGLREKVDLYQAQMTEKNQWERVISSKRMMEESRNTLSTKLHRVVTEQEVDALQLMTPKYLKIPQVKWNNSIERKLLTEQKELAELALKIIDNSFIPNINLMGSYQTNDYAGSSSSAMSEGSMGGGQREVVAALSLNWGLGNSFRKSNEAKQRAVILLNSVALKKKHHSHIDTVSSLYHRMKLIDQSIDSVKGRIVLARKVLKEIEKLYNQGRAGVDRLLDAESGLIATENNYASYIFAKKLLIGNLYYLNGELKKTLIQ